MGENVAVSSPPSLVLPSGAASGAAPGVALLRAATTTVREPPAWRWEVGRSRQVKPQNSSRLGRQWIHPASSTKMLLPRSIWSIQVLTLTHLKHEHVERTPDRLVHQAAGNGARHIASVVGHFLGGNVFKSFDSYWSLFSVWKWLCFYIPPHVTAMFMGKSIDSTSPYPAFR